MIWKEIINLITKIIIKCCLDVIKKETSVLAFLHKEPNKQNNNGVYVLINTVKPSVIFNQYKLSLLNNIKRVFETTIIIPIKIDIIGGAIALFK